MNNTKLVSAIIVSSAVAYGCASMTEEQKALVGKLTGGAAGGLLAERVSRDIDNDVMRAGVILAGVAVGAYIGDQFAKALSKPDQEKLFVAQQQAAATNQPVSFTGEEGVSGRVSVVREQPETKQNKVVQVKVLKDKVEQTPPLDLVGAPYRPGKATNLRGGPGTDFRVVGSLAGGQVVQVIGKVRGKEWFLVSQTADGAASGYAYSPLLSPADQGMQVVQTGSEAVASVQVEATSICKTVRQEVTTSNGTITDDIRVCQQGDGTWKLA